MDKHDVQNAGGLFERIEVQQVVGEIEDNYTGISQDSRLIQPGFIFVARRGEQADGMKFIEDAIQRGATTIVTDQEVPEGQSVPFVRVKEIHHALVSLSQRIYGDPSRKLKLIGITGTNGKTTSCFLIRSILQAAGFKCGLMGTIGYFSGKKWTPAKMTTPDIDRINAILAEMVVNGCTWAVIEVSSHALALGRVDGLRFIAGGFTNLTREHQDFHPSLDDYADAKARLFELLPEDGLGVANVSDLWGVRMQAASKAPVVTYGDESSGADIAIDFLDHSLNGGVYRLNRSDESFEVRTPLIGSYHGFNVALAAGVTLGLGIDKQAVIEGVAGVELVEGRMEPVKGGQDFAVLVDYSHTPDALENALKSAGKLCQGNLIAVFGCGGNRDKKKRPEMGQIAVEYADTVIVTSDNPRFEEPDLIIRDILEGIAGEHRNAVIVEPDRRKAIAKAVALARPEDVVLISGKGHETYQEIRGVRHPFDDRQVALGALQALSSVK